MPRDSKRVTLVPDAPEQVAMDEKPIKDHGEEEANRIEGEEERVAGNGSGRLGARGEVKFALVKKYIGQLDQQCGGEVGMIFSGRDGCPKGTSYDNVVDPTLRGCRLQGKTRYE